jgi:hypothetical protein
LEDEFVEDDEFNPSVFNAAATFGQLLLVVLVLLAE